MLKKLKKRENRYIHTINRAYLFLPLILIPLLIEWYFHIKEVDFFIRHKESFLIVDILYIVLARFILLDSALYIFSRSPHPPNATLMRIVMLYLEITVITILYYAIVFYIFDVFHMFHLNTHLPIQSLNEIQSNPFLPSLYISAVTFTTLGLGDWTPQTLHAMVAVTSEVILGVIQGGVFVAIVIYGHQNGIVSNNK